MHPKKNHFALGVALVTTASLFTHAHAASAQQGFFPDTLPLPNGFQPEGVAAYGLDLLAGSLIDGDIYRVSAITGEGELAIDAPEGRTALGLRADRRGRVFVAGGPLGAAYVYDVETGEALAEYQLVEPGSAGLVNDVVITHEAAYFTDSLRAVIYALPLGPRGALPDPSEVVAIELSGPAADDIAAEQFNLNGIEYAWWARKLIVVNTYRGALYTIDPETGESERIDTGDADLSNGDGLVRRGLRLYVVQNFQNQIAVVRLRADLRSGEVVRTITDARFMVPTTADAIGPYLFAVNARFDVAPPPLAGTPPSDPTLEFDIVRVPAR
jgi:sugar lactone lactonase YvrE